jgi:hypothetical protein
MEEELARRTLPVSPITVDSIAVEFMRTDAVLHALFPSSGDPPAPLGI